MKLSKVLSPSATALLSDLRTQRILRELVTSEYSVTELSGRLNIPPVTLWKKVQRLLAADLIELSSVKKAGNLERKMYRATAVNYYPAQFLPAAPKDPRLMRLFGIYSEIQKMTMALQAKDHEIPAGVDPIDFALYRGLRAFVDIHSSPEFQKRIVELDDELREYERSRR